LLVIIVLGMLISEPPPHKFLSTFIRKWHIFWYIFMHNAYNSMMLIPHTHTATLLGTPASSDYAMAAFTRPERQARGIEEASRQRQAEDGRNLSRSMARIRSTPRGLHQNGPSRRVLKFSSQN